MATTFDFTSSDGTRIVGWRNDAPGLPVVISNGLGTPPAAWPEVIRPDSGLRVASWYYRGTGDGDRPRDPDRIRIGDHVDDLISLMDAEGMDQALLACWSLGVNVGFEAARRHPDRVAGLLAVPVFPAARSGPCSDRCGCPADGGTTSVWPPPGSACASARSCPGSPVTFRSTG
jgi:3-oxoadipate enol-lactonase